MKTNAQGQLVQFIWQGHIHPIRRVAQAWQVDTDWWSEEGRVWRDYRTVITEDGLLCVLYFDNLEQEWCLAKIYD